MPQGALHLFSPWATQMFLCHSCPCPCPSKASLCILLQYSKPTHPPPPLFWLLSLFWKEGWKQTLAWVVAVQHAGHWRIADKKKKKKSPSPWCFWPPLPLNCPCFQSPAFVQGQERARLLGFPFLLGSQSHSSQLGDCEVLVHALAWWGDQNGESSCCLCGQLAGPHALGHCYR